MIPKYFTCPHCDNVIHTDANNNLYVDCPYCLTRIYLGGDDE